MWKTCFRGDKFLLTFILISSIISTCKVSVLYRGDTFPSAKTVIFCAMRRKGGLKLAKNLEIAVLMDFYGEMLTEKQRSFLEYYYNDDLSLSEIAENEGITRQGVRDAIKRAETQLFDMESRLGVVARFEDVRRGLNEIIDYSNQISEYNIRHSLSREINDFSVRIKATAMTLLE